MQSRTHQEFLDCYSRIHKLALGMVRSFRFCSETNMDILQDVTTQVWKNFHQVRDMERLPAWVRTIARNRCFRELRRRYADRNTFETPRRALEEFPQEGPDSFATENLERMEQLEHWLLDKAETREGRVIHAFYFENSSVDQIAASSGMKRGTVCSVLHRTRQSIRAKMSSTLA